MNLKAPAMRFSLAKKTFLPHTDWSSTAKSSSVDPVFGSTVQNTPTWSGLEVQVYLCLYWNSFQAEVAGIFREETKVQIVSFPPEAKGDLDSFQAPLISHS